MENLKTGDHVLVRGTVSSDRGDDHVVVKFERHGATAYVPRDQVEFLHSDFKVGDRVMKTGYRFVAEVVAVVGAVAWICWPDKSNTLAEFHELTIAPAPIENFVELEIPPAPPAAPGDPVVEI